MNHEEPWRQKSMIFVVYNTTFPKPNGIQDLDARLSENPFWTAYRLPFTTFFIIIKDITSSCRYYIIDCAQIVNALKKKHDRAFIAISFLIEYS